MSFLICFPAAHIAEYGQMSSQNLQALAMGLSSATYHAEKIRKKTESREAVIEMESTGETSHAGSARMPEILKRRT
jgi:hypothetical protein